MPCQPPKMGLFYLRKTMPSYTPLYKSGQILLGTGHPVIVAGWTLAKTIAAKIPSTDYAAIGQLYNPARGINLLVRNLLANPPVRNLIVLSATPADRNAKGCERIRDFWNNGVEPHSEDGKEYWRIRGEGPVGLIDREVPLECLEQLRRYVEMAYCETLDELLIQVGIHSTEILPPWHPTPQIFPMESPSPTVYPGPRYGHCIQGRTIAETWVKIIHRIKTTGTIRPTGYGGNWQELIDLVAVVTDEPEGFLFPEPNYLPCDRPFIKGYVTQILDDAPHREGVKYTYGQRLRSWFGVDQVEQVIAKLNGEIDAASAVMNLWDVADHDRGGSPCLNHIWLRVVDGEMSLTATFRSNDMFSAWPSNAMGLRALQKHILDRVEGATRLGPLITVSQSAHIYDDCWDNADALIRNHLVQRPRYDDPAGDFLVMVERQVSANPGQGKVVVTQTFPAGTECRRWEGRTAAHLMRQIARDVPHLQVPHALYLGGEIDRACRCLREDRGFIQDQP